MEDCRYNSAVYTSLATNDFFMVYVASNHFDPGAYSNTTEVAFELGVMSRNATTGKEYGDIGYQTNSHDIKQFIRLLEG